MRSGPLYCPPLGSLCPLPLPSAPRCPEMRLSHPVSSHPTDCVWRLLPPWDPLPFRRVSWAGLELGSHLPGRPVRNTSPSSVTPCFTPPSSSPYAPPSGQARTPGSSLASSVPGVRSRRSSPPSPSAAGVGVGWGVGGRSVQGSSVSHLSAGPSLAPAMERGCTWHSLSCSAVRPPRSRRRTAPFPHSSGSSVRPSLLATVSRVES